MTHPGHDPDADAATDHRFELVMSVVVVAAVVIGLLVVLALTAGDGNGSPTAGGGTSSSPTSGATSNWLPTSASETPAPPRTTPPPKTSASTEGPGVNPQVQDVSIDAMGPGFQPGESTFHFDNEGIPEFDGPDDWGCLTMGKGDLGVFHVNCINDGGTFPTNPSGSGGSIIIYTCEASCDIAEAREKLARATRFVDRRKPSQDYVTGSETAPTPGDPGTVRLLMATPWESGPGDKIVVVSIEALPAEVDDVRNIIRSIYESAHS